MGTIINLVKIMPEGLEVDLHKLKHDVEAFLKKMGAKNLNFKEEEIAFGLKAIIAGYDWPEDKSMDPVEEGFQKINGVSTIEVVEQRRAF